jgi:hypothetical protein
MTNCCDANGNCTQGKDCAIRKQHREATNQAYINHGRTTDTDPYSDTFGTFKALISVLVVCVAVTLISFFIWGK